MNELTLETYEPTYEALSIIYGVCESDHEVFKSYVYTGYLMESGASPDIVMEGVNDMFKAIANDIKKFIEKVKEFFKKILLYITSATEDLDKLANEVEPVLKDKKINYEINGFTFTVVDKPAPDMREFNRIVDDYNSDMAELTKLKEAEIKKQIFNWLDESHLDKLRGEILGSGGSIDADDYLDEIRKFYRNGEISTDKIKVTNSMVNQIISHAKKLEEVKRSSIKDRDNLISLLTKTEAFFNTALPTVFKGAQRQVNVAKIDTSDNKFSKEDNYRTADDSVMRMLSTYASAKSKQVNKVASMINLVACERVNALKDQISQERKILRSCLFSSDTESKVSESVMDLGYGGRQFDTYAIESVLTDGKLYDALSRQVYLNEARFLIESITSGEVCYLMEADMNSTTGKIKNAIANIIDSIIKTFRKKAMGEADKYKPWITDIKDGIQEKAKNKKEFTMASFLDADHAAMANKIMGAIKKAYSSTNYEDATFAKDVVSSIDTFEKINDDSSRTIMLNYFRTGKAGEKIDTVTLSGSQLAGKVTEMMNYISQYGSTVTKPAENISNTLKTQSEAFKVTESLITGNTYLSLIEAPICESDVILCKDYGSIFGSVMEADKPNIGGKPEGFGGTSDAKKPEATGQSGKAESDAVDGELKSATQVKSENTEDVKGDQGVAEKKTNEKAVAYRKNVDRFFKNAITLYIRAREEQFIAYVNALADIDGARPKFDDNGKYIPKANQKKDTEVEEPKATDGEDVTGTKSK